MPELPEVESVARALRHNLVGKRCKAMRVRFAGVLAPSSRGVRSAMVGRSLLGVHRHGKYLILAFSGQSESLRGSRSSGVSVREDGSGACVMVHLRMTGQIFVQDDYVPDKHVHLSLDFDGLPVHYRDIRKFGRWSVVEDPERPAALAHVGPDMLEIRLRDWLPRVARRGAPFKSVLLDQGVAAGMGNIYADEALFHAGVHPLARPVDLPREVLQRVLRESRTVLRLAIRHGGTTFINFANFHGKPGNFRSKLRVYGRTGEPCRCGTAIERIVVGGRSTHFCPVCQGRTETGEVRLRDG